MDAITHAFHGIIAEANTAHRIYNTRGPRAGLYVLAGLKEKTEALMVHLKRMGDAREAQE